MRLGHTLTTLDSKGGMIVMTFAAPEGARSERFDAVILTLPFTRLRHVEGPEASEARVAEDEVHSRTRLRDECQGH